MVIFTSSSRVKFLMFISNSDPIGEGLAMEALVEVAVP